MMYISLAIGIAGSAIVIGSAVIGAVMAVLTAHDFMEMD